MAAMAMATVLSIAAHGIGADKENANVDASAPAEKSGVKHSITYRLRLKPSKDPKTGEERAVDAAALAKATEVLGKRLDAATFTNVLVTPQPPDRILMQADALTPGQIAAARQCLMLTAALDLRTVHGDNDTLLPEIESKKAALDPAWIVLPMKEVSKSEDMLRRLIVKRVPEITGDEFKSAYAVFGPEGWSVSVELEKKAGERFFWITRKMRKGIDRFAIVLDGEILSAPTTQVEGGIAGNSFLLTGGFTEQEVRDLASALMNPLHNPVVIEEESVK
jgi:preprotein translocase subunit SecD